MSIIMPHLLLQYTTRYFYVFYISVMQCKQVDVYLGRYTLYQPSTYLKFSTCLGIEGNIFSDFALVCALVRRSRRTDNIFCGNQLQIEFWPLFDTNCQNCAQFRVVSFDKLYLFAKNILKCSKSQNVMLDGLQGFLILATNIYYYKINIFNEV